jgi:hypothetical protein
MTSIPSSSFAKLLTLVLGILTVTGCSTTRPNTAGHASNVSIDNSFSLFEKIPQHVRRVALLPITHEVDNWHASASMPHVAPLLRTELRKLNRFETVAITQEQLTTWTGQKGIQASDILPLEILIHLQRDLGCDAVLLAHLQSYHPYKPLVVGWKFHLVDLRLQSVLWAADETYDASDESIVERAKYYSKKTYKLVRGANDSERILLSPQHFNQFTLASILGSLPPRTPNDHE